MIPLPRSLLLFSLFFSLTLAACPNGCSSPNGVCGGSGCVCLAPWKGDDCSIFDQYLNSGETVHSSVKKNDWKFYRHDVLNPATTLVWIVNITDEQIPQDVDLYLQYEQYPSRTAYLLEDTTLDQNFALTLTEVKQGTYYAGVFGFTDANYAISVREMITCPNDCFGHGHCDQGECSCYPNYGGENCEFEFHRLSPGDNLLGQVPEGSWDYYNVEVHDIGSTVTFIVEELPLSEEEPSDCDLYLAYERIPNRWDWDLSNITIGDSSSIVFTNEDTGIYVLGIYGFSQCSFHVNVTIASDSSSCPNECSDHGSCFTGECDCNPGFEGLSCDWMVAPLFLARSQTGFVGKNAWNYFHARAITESLLVITVQQTEGDCDLYVKADEKPDRFVYDYFKKSTYFGIFSFGDTVSITIPEPGDHTWFIGVFGQESCRFSIVIDEREACECGENNPNGECLEGQSECFCHDGWTGDDCSQPQMTLENGVAVSSSVKSHQWKYFELPADTTTTGIVSLQESSSVGLVWLYVSYTGTPSLNTFDLMDNQANSAHEISIALPQPTGRSIYIGVYGSPFITHEETEVEFKLVGWGAPF